MTQAAAGDGALPRLLTALPRVHSAAWGSPWPWPGRPLLTAVLAPLRDDLALASILLLFLLAVVVVALVGGAWAAVVAAVWSFLLANWFLTPPLHTLRVEEPRQPRRPGRVPRGRADRQRARRPRREPDGRGRAQPGRGRAARAGSRPSRWRRPRVEYVLSEVATAFGMRSVALVGTDPATPVALVGPPFTGHPAVQVDAGPGLRLMADGPTPFAEDRRLLGDLAARGRPRARGRTALRPGGPRPRARRGRPAAVRVARRGRPRPAHAAGRHHRGGECAAAAGRRAAAGRARRARWPRSRRRPAGSPTWWRTCST